MSCTGGPVEITSETGCGCGLTCKIAAGGAGSVSITNSGTQTATGVFNVKNAVLLKFSAFICFMAMLLY